MMKVVLLALCVVAACFAAPVQVNKELPQNDEWCSICQFIIGYVEGEIANNNTEENIIHVVESICDIVPSSLRSQCRSFVALYGTEIIQLLINDEPASVICSQIGLCDSKKDDVVFIPEPEDAQDCSVCEFVMGYVETQLANNNTEQNIEKVLDDVCQIVPSAFRAQCVSLINQYTQQLIQLLLNQESPTVICTQIGLCSSAKKAIVQVQSSQYCTICEFVLSTVDQYLDTNSTEQQIILFIENVCYILPSSVRQECDDLISTYATEIISLLVQDYPPNVICSMIGLCSSEKQVHIQARGNPAECAICISIITQVEALSLESTQSIMQALSLACANLPDPAWSSSCKVWVQQVGPAIIQQIKSQQPPQSICAGFGVCAN